MNQDMNTSRFESEAEQTRERIASTIDDLQDRLNPRAAIQDVADTIQDTGEALIDSAVRLAREHPVILAIAGLGAGLVAIARSRLLSGSAYSYGSDYPTYGYEDEASGGDGAGGGEGSASAVDKSLRRRWSKARQQAGSVTQNLTDSAHHARDVASDAWTKARERTSDYAFEARDRSAEARMRAYDTIEDNPLAAALVGLSAGALVGLLLPHTDLEDRNLGQTSDRLTEAARSAAVSAGRTAAEVGRRELEDLGLNRENARAKLAEIGDQAREVARHAGEAAVSDLKSHAQGTPFQPNNVASS